MSASRAGPGGTDLPDKSGDSVRQSTKGLRPFVGPDDVETLTNKMNEV